MIYVTTKRNCSLKVHGHRTMDIGGFMIFTSGTLAIKAQLANLNHWTVFCFFTL